MSFTKTPEAPAREGWRHGKAIVGQKLRYLSASAMQLADSTSPTGCARRWYYAYKLGLKEPPSPQQDRGKELHGQVEHYLRTGDRAGLTSTVLSGMSIIPEHGADLFIEHDILLLTADELVARDADMLALDAEAAGDAERARKHRADALAIRMNAIIDLAPVRAAGVPLVGSIDLMHARGLNKGTTDVEDTVDPDGTIEVLDWKFTGDLRYAKTVAELPKTIQMATYAKFVYTTAPDATGVRLSHGYIPARGNPRKVTVRVSRDQVEETWNRIEGLAGYLRDAASHDEAHGVDANTKACRAFGRPCPASGVCRAQMTTSLASVVGVTSAENLLKKIRKEPQMTAPTTTPTPTGMSALGARLGAKSAPDPKVVAAEKKRLARDAVLAKYPGLDKTVESIKASGLGFPTMVGTGADALNKILDLAPISHKDQLKIPGDGELAGFEIEDAALLEGVLADVLAEVAERASKASTAAELPPPALVAPEAPDSTGVTTVVSVTAPSVASGASGSTAAAEIAAQADAAPKKTRAKKTSAAPAVAPTAPTATPATATPLGTAINLFVDVSIEGAGETIQSMWPLIDRICGAMTADSGAGDFRHADPAGKYGYGRWKGILAECIRAEPPSAGDWLLNGHYGSDITEIVVETMRGIVTASGGKIYRGIR